MVKYDADSASNYQKFRPPIHKKILKHCLQDKRFEIALDVGCGVGNSSIALTSFCEKVVGFDTSHHMIQKAILKNGITYTSEISKLNSKFNLICFFGSLFYIDQQSITLYLNHLTERGTIVCCDFEILYQSVWEHLGMELKINPLNYNHQKNLSEYTISNVRSIRSDQFKTTFSCTSNQLVYLILSEKDLVEALSSSINISDLYSFLLNKIDHYYSDQKIRLTAECHFSLYEGNP
ncbi:MAG: class I SAM-dependent methyltransferase [Flavobacteriaceae bacterium]